MAVSLAETTRATKGQLFGHWRLTRIGLGLVLGSIVALLVVPPIPGMFWSPATVVFLISAFGVGVIGSILFLAGFVGVIRAELKYGK